MNYDQIIINEGTEHEKRWAAQTAEEIIATIESAFAKAREVVFCEKRCRREERRKTYNYCKAQGLKNISVRDNGDGTHTATFKFKKEACAESVSFSAKDQAILEKILSEDEVPR